MSGPDRPGLPPAGDEPEEKHVPEVMDFSSGELDMAALDQMAGDVEIEMEGEPEPTPAAAAPPARAAAPPKAASRLETDTLKVLVEALQLEKGQLAAQVEALRAEVAASVERHNEMVQTVQRRQADFENYRKRVQRDMEEAKSAGRAEGVLRIVELLDNMGRALEHCPEGLPADFLEGLRLIERQVRGALEGWEVKEVPGAGEPFDPAVHAAFMSVEGPEPNRIVQVFEKGYTMGGKLLRPARVSVSKSP